MSIFNFTIEKNIKNLVHYGFFFFLKLLIISNIIHTQLYCNMNNLKIDNVNVEYDFKC